MLSWEDLDEAQVIAELIKSRLSDLYSQPRLVIHPVTGETVHKPANQPYPDLDKTK